MQNSLRELYRRYERWVPIIFFVLGFILDALVLNRIDDPFVIIHQAIYLILSALLIRVELLEGIREIQIPGFLSRVWKYREALLHFLLGTLLNCYTIFYFKSASAFTSFVFILILIALLMINEFKRFGESQTKVHIAFLGLSLVSYLSSLVPILLGFIGTIPFLIASLLSALIFYSYVKWLRRDLENHPTKIRTHLLQPYILVHAIYAGLYFAHAIPPVPLSIEYIGIYHDIQKDSGRYQLTYTRPDWRFWEHGDQTFLARPGDAIHCFVQVFSPSRFKDKLQVRWSLYDEKRGWLPQDAIPLPILGGREEGYRTYTKKENYVPGEWRVQVETLEGHEVGRIDFTVISDSSEETPLRKIEIR